MMRSQNNVKGRFFSTFAKMPTLIVPFADRQEEIIRAQGNDTDARVVLRMKRPRDEAPVDMLVVEQSARKRHTGSKRIHSLVLKSLMADGSARIPKSDGNG